MTFSTDPPLISDLSLIPGTDEKADLDAPSNTGGKLVVAQVPNISISSTTVVADETERLGLDVQEGDLAIQSDNATSFIFTGGDNVAANWQEVQFDAVGAIDGEDINPRDITPRDITASGHISLQDLTVTGAINGADTSAATAGEALTSDGSGGFSFATVGGIATASTFNNLPTPNPPQIGYVENGGQYYVSKDNIGAFDLSTASFDNVTLSTQDTTSAGMAFDNNGTAMFEIGQSNNNFYQYSLSVPFDLSTATYDNVYLSTQDVAPRDMAFNDDGTAMFEVGKFSTNFYQYSLSSPFDLSTATFDNVTLSTQDGDPRDMAFSTDGTAMFEVGSDSNTFYQYSLSSPFDLSTATFDNVTLSTQDNVSTGMAFNANGTAMFEVGGSSNRFYQYSLSVPFDLSTASFDNVTLPTQDSGPRGMAFNANGTAMFEVGSGSNNFYQYSLATSNGWEVLQ